jgi:hypothetical protein
MKTAPRTVDRAAEVRANRRKAAESVAFAHNENALVIQESHCPVQIIVRFAGLESLIRFEEDVRHQKPHSAGRGGRDGEDGSKPTEDQLNKTAS